MQLRQLSPLSVAHLSQLRATFSDWRSGSPECSEDVNLFRSWFLYDSGLTLMGGVRRTNWNAVMGIMLAGIVSAGFWTGLGITVAQFYK